MKETIANHDDYISLMATIEKMLQKATQKVVLPIYCPKKPMNWRVCRFWRKLTKMLFPFFPSIRRSLWNK